MVSSVSSEKAFSQGGIMITKCCNHLKCDIVEALQCVKSEICHGLIFCEPAPSSVLQAEFDNSDEGASEYELKNVEEELWDGMLVDDDVEMEDTEFD